MQKFLQKDKQLEKTEKPDHPSCRETFEGCTLVLILFEHIHHLTDVRTKGVGHGTAIRR